MTASTKLPGVYPTHKKDGTPYYRASLTHKGRHISLGSYDTMNQAHLAYLEGCRILKEPSLRIDDYDQRTQILKFDKWVSLINLRDNGIFFSNPIYIRNKYFEYYLSYDQVLKFDMDDLFYYSSHKIIQRNGHLFVSDYGMQYNIRNRYGIKSYAVEGRDYCHSNGDRFDMRYENICILNHYHGVSLKEKNGQLLYQTVIHVRGNYLVGTYATPIEAAIAYNKAIDILRKNGVTKKYTPNYIEGFPSRQYAEVYSQLTISEKLLAYRPPTLPNNQ